MQNLTSVVGFQTQHLDRKGSIVRKEDSNRTITCPHQYQLSLLSLHSLGTMDDSLNCQKLGSLRNLHKIRRL